MRFPAIFSGLVIIFVTVASGVAPSLRAEEAVNGSTVSPSASPTARSEEPGFFQRLRQGGITMVFLAVASLAGLTFSLERALNLRRVRIVPAGLSDRLNRDWMAGNYGVVQEEAQSSRSTLGRVVASIVRHRNYSPAEISELASEVASREMRRHLQRAYPISVVAMISPLLGLFGTVIGMIEAFESVASLGALGDASTLADSISKALITTATGLAIAMPCLAIYHFFKGRTQSLSLLLEEETNELISRWFRHPEYAEE